MTAAATAWGGPARARLAEFADALVPAGGSMPAASEVGVHAEGLDRVLEVRPDLAEPLRRVVAGDAADVLEALHRLQETDDDGWTALATCVTAAYYMSPTVRRLLGYSGQEGVVITSDDFFSWASSGLLDPVLERGPLRP
jgi:hypothetical protein